MIGEDSMGNAVLSSSTKVERNEESSIAMYADFMRMRDQMRMPGTHCWMKSGQLKKIGLTNALSTSVPHLMNAVVITGPHEHFERWLVCIDRVTTDEQIQARL